MICGDIFKWVTDKAIGHPTRQKIQVFIGEVGWPGDGQLFLMVNSRQYGADYLISVANYPEILDYDSFISCNDGPTYSASEIDKLALAPIGRLSKHDIAGLRNQIIACGAMEQWMENFCCAELAKNC